MSYFLCSLHRERNVKNRTYFFLRRKHKCIINKIKDNIWHSYSCLFGCLFLTQTLPAKENKNYICLSFFYHLEISLFYSFCYTWPRLFLAVSFQRPSQFSHLTWQTTETEIIFNLDIHTRLQFKALFLCIKWFDNGMRIYVLWSWTTRSV